MLEHLLVPFVPDSTSEIAQYCDLAIMYQGFLVVISRGSVIAQLWCCASCLLVSFVGYDYRQQK
jgi:hypothetical protein